MATYGSNQIAVRFFQTPQSEAQSEKKSQAMPAHTPVIGSVMLGGKQSRYPRGMKDLDKPSWNRPRHTRKRKAKRHPLASLMGF
jgi:hypothetical protein